MFCGEEFLAERFKLNRGDRIILVTDGISEARNSSGLEFGMEPLTEFVKTQKALPASGLVHSLVAAAAEFRSDAPRVDDVTVLVLDYVG
jgi:sigma-B regulation protein RsbU (phosphoserine phosphatase)